MKIILLFDTELLDGPYREYELSDELDSALAVGGKVQITLCHPDEGEVFEAKEVS